ncbi:MAG: hypothetical protein CFE21_19550 [Bacteroidetes bacterium B1(2017)]|nr:MAG: hypothetical protein CFE21_19550 [Bacteroidetes bacterium B1(2017)]
MKKFNDLLNYFSAIILFIAVVGILLLSYTHLKKPEDPKKILIEYKIVQDTTNFKQIANLKQIDSLLLEVKGLANNIQSKQIETIKDTEEKDFFNKFYSIIVAVILVIAGFFGYKNISEIKQRAIEEAEESAKKIAEEKSVEVSNREFEKIFTQQYKGEVLNLATESFSTTFNEEYIKIRDIQLTLEKRIENLENKSNIINDYPNPETPQEDGDSEDQETKNVEPINPFGNE